jgi:hypothetical protein
MLQTGGVHRAWQHNTCKIKKKEPSRHTNIKKEKSKIKKGKKKESKQKMRKIKKEGRKEK